jgi:hypothetical protein
MTVFRHKLFVFFFPFLLWAPLAEAQTFKPFTRLFVVQTAHFDIIYPAQSRPTALRLASFADSVYDEVSLLLGITVKDRIPVTITPDTDQFNGYMNPFPYTHIVLFDTPMDIEWTTFQDPLRSLFLHELTHAISLNSRGGIAPFLHDIFGSWVNPTFLTAPLFMVEGVTVSFESLEGYGRANDPLVQQRIRQAVAENKALSPFQASGVYDLPPLGRAYYEYGGLFSSWLQKAYGMERYGELWQAMGSRIPLGLFYYNHGFARIFKDTYGLPLTDAWQSFLTSYKTDEVQAPANSDLLLQDMQITSLAAADGALYGIDSRTQSLFKVDVPPPGRQAKKSTLRPIPPSAYELSINKSQDRLLLSYYRYTGDLATAVVEEYTTTGKATGRVWQGLYKASYFRDGIAGLASELHRTNLVYVDSSGFRHTLARGGERVLFSKPVPIDDNRIALIISIQGQRKLAVFQVDEGRFYIIKTALQDDAERWRYIRNLSARGTRLLFTYNNDHSFYRLGFLDLDAADPEQALSFSEEHISGGILLPVQTSEILVYRAAGSTWDSLVRLHQTENKLHTGYTLEALDLEKEEPVLPSALQLRFTEEKYNPVHYLNPLKFWLPAPLINNVDNSIRIDGMGIITLLGDPTESNSVLINAGGDVVGKIGYFDASWASINLGFPIFMSFSDQMEAVESSSGYTMYRASRLSVSTPFTLPLGDGTVTVHLMPSLALLLAAFDPGDGSSAYFWTYKKPLWTYGLNLGISNLYRKPWQLLGNGIGFDIYARSTGDPESSGRLDTALRASWEPPASWFGLRGTLYAAWDRRGMSLDGKNPSFGNAPFADVAAVEYTSQTPDSLPWIAGGEVETKLFALELQSNISHIYINRFFATLAYRAVMYERVAESNLQTAGFALGNNLYGYHSVIAKFGTVVSAVPITMAPLRYSPFFWAAVKLSNLRDQDPNNDFQLGFALSLEW